MQMLLALALLALSAHPSQVAAQAAAAAAYAPSLTPCPPGTSLLRETDPTDQSLSPGESAYISTRRTEMLPEAWANYLTAVLQSIDESITLPEYVSDIMGGSCGVPNLPTLGIATSGGSYRAAIFGAGVLNTIDGRNATSVRAGTGGLLQSASYLAGLSGGGWLVGSLIQADFPTLPDLIFGNPTASADAWGGWNAQTDILQPSSNATIDSAYLVDLVEETMGKHAAGFPVTLADIWGRTLSRHFANGTNSLNILDNSLPHGAGLTFSSIAELPSFKSHEQPFPIILSESQSVHQNSSLIQNVSSAVVPLSNPIYEFNVFEFGSFDPMLSAFTPTKFLGSPNKSICATGFDQISFIEGTTAELFNGENTTSAAFFASPVGPIVELIEALIPEPGLEMDVALVPNPFFGVAPSMFIDSNEELLSLVDGGEDGEVIPIQPLLVKARGVDVVLAIDAAADTDDNFSDGSSLVTTQKRAALFPSSYSFPHVPANQSVFLAQGLTKRPTFFGCNAPSDSAAPLVIYMANGGAPLGQVPVTNVSTDQLSFAPEQIDAMLTQTFDVATQGIPIEKTVGRQTVLDKDPEWPACLACAVVDRSRERQGMVRSGICESCLERYCWS
ncbi:lysophospholipase [Obba rivulosa]|uniref:Lysophospholipase n=1 Tax=Obba rivulosa TaxID=1052685 RepID=A0A8E2DTD8_9APHY|nr:lysophospholipase [Obba rivulosa]